MKRYLLLCFVVISICGCVQTLPSRKEAFSKRDAYLKQPDNNIMFVVDELQETFLAPPIIQCHANLGMLADPGSRNKSFETYTPFVTIFAAGELITNIKSDYAKLSERDKERFLSSLPLLNPTFVVVCQSQNPVGIEGKIYFDGKVVSSDTANIDYGVVSLKYTLHLEEFIE